MGTVEEATAAITEEEEITVATTEEEEITVATTDERGSYHGDDRGGSFCSND